MSGEAPRYVFCRGDRVRATLDGHLVEGVITGDFPAEGVVADPGCPAGTADILTAAGTVLSVPLAALEAGEDGKPPNARQVAARAFMYLAGAALLVLGGFAYHSDRISFRDVIGLIACVVVYVVAALLLRREKGRQQ